MFKSKRRRQNFGMLLGIACGVALLAVLVLPERQPLHARGPMNTGHQDLRCEYCHLPARGTGRQQIQANARYLLGLRASAADFGLQKVGSAQCLACHARPSDRHPVFRFSEPRFQEVRDTLHPESCVACHLEHSGVRVTVADSRFCRHCHEETSMKKDPIDVPHADLIADEQWNTCLGCHDFHGNHVMDVARQVRNAFSPRQIQDYFRGGPSPYGTQIKYAPRKEPES
jgi:hypothetical protein